MTTQRITIESGRDLAVDGARHPGALSGGSDGCTAD
jgi:hypothetical protein